MDNTETSQDEKSSLVRNNGNEAFKKITGLSSRTIFIMAVILRAIIYSIPASSDGLAFRVELTNCFVGLPYIKDTAFLLRMGVKVYDYSTSLPMPLVLLVAKLFPSKMLECIFFIGIDLAVAYYLSLIAGHKLGKSSNGVTLVAFFAAKSTSALVHLTLVGALYHALCGDVLASLSYTALGTYISLYPISMMGPVLILLPQKSIRFKLSIFGLILWVLLLASWVWTGSWRFILSSHGSRLTFASLKPNVGLYWYLFVEMFDFFRPFFISFLQIHILFYGFPVAVRFRKDPLFMAFIVISLQSLLQPYPTLADAGLYLSMIPLFPELLHSLKFLYPSLMVMLFACVLAPVNWYYWIHQGSGNANFYYATTLIYNVPNVLIIVEMIRNHIWNEVLRYNPGLTLADLYQK